MDSLLGFVNSKDTQNLPTKDYLRFNQLVWPVPDSRYGDEDKYFNQRYVVLSELQLAMFNTLLTVGYNRPSGWSYRQLIDSLKVCLIKHTEILRTDFELAKLASLHTGAALKIDTSDGQAFNNILKRITIDTPLVVFRTLDRDYLPSLSVGQEADTENIWSTSYDPISSMGFALSDPDIKKIYVVKAILPAGFRGGLLVENNIGDIIKEQHEFTIASGVCFVVMSITDNVEIRLFDDADQVRTVLAKIYTITACH